jgi:SAM-dependent methyltransferase
VRGIPRFVGNDHYVGSFSFEWLTHCTTQLDSRTGKTESELTLRQKTGLSPEAVRDKLVLDAGVGAGRFSEVLLRWGARVAAVDLSFAVEAARENLKDHAELVLAQADIGRLPFAPGTFDFIVSIGVLHHTSDTKAHFAGLVPLLKPGGTICVWVYPNEGDYAKRAAWIPFTRRIPSRWFHSWCKCFVPLARRARAHPLVAFLQGVFPVSDQGLGLENDVLDTFDAYSPWFHGVHTPEEVMQWSREAGLVNVRSLSRDTSVRGERPPSPEGG